MVMILLSTFILSMGLPLEFSQLSVWQSYPTSEPPPYTMDAKFVFSQEFSFYCVQAVTSANVFLSSSLLLAFCMAILSQVFFFYISCHLECNTYLCLQCFISYSEDTRFAAFQALSLGKCLLACSKFQALVRAIYLKCTEVNDDVCYKIGCTVELLTKILTLVFLLLLADESDPPSPSPRISFLIFTQEKLNVQYHSDSSYLNTSAWKMHTYNELGLKYYAQGHRVIWQDIDPSQLVLPKY